MMKNIKAIFRVGDDVINVVYNDGSAIAELWENGEVIKTNVFTVDEFNYDKWLEERQFEDSIGYGKLFLY